MAIQPEDNKKYKLPKGIAKGIKRTRGQPILHDERKVNVNLTLSPTAREYLRSAAQVRGVSMSELVEQWARTILSQEGI